MAAMFQPRCPRDDNRQVRIAVTAAERLTSAETAVETRSFNMPIVKTFGLARVAPRQQITINLDEDLNDVTFFEKLRLKLWTAQRTITIDEVPGLFAAVHYRE